MEISSEDPVFNINRQFELWAVGLKQNNAFAGDDFEELKLHMLDSIDELKKAGLDDEEAFIIARKRIGDTREWEDDFKEINKGVIQLKNSLVIFSGVLLYYIAYNLLLLSYKASILFMHHALHLNFISIIEWTMRYIVAYHFVFILLFSSIYFFEKRVVEFLDNIKITTKRAIWAFVVLVLLAMADISTLPFVNQITKQNQGFMNRFYDLNRFLDFSFPLLFCLAYIFFYIKYSKNKAVI